MPGSLFPRDIREMVKKLNVVGRGVGRGREREDFCQPKRTLVGDWMDDDEGTDRDRVRDEDEGGIKGRG